MRRLSQPYRHDEVNENNTKRKGNKCLGLLRKFDLYSPSFQFRLPDGKSEYQTATGGTFCLLFSALVLVYAITSGINIIRREGYSIVEMAKEGVYSDLTFSFKKDDGFAVAAAVWHGDTSLNMEDEDPEVGQIKFVIKNWENPNQMNFREVKTRSCQPEDITIPEGETRNEYGFYPFESDTAGNLESVKDRMVCTDEPYEIKGHYDSYTTANLMVVYEICNPEKRICKSREQIEKYLEFTYILLVENRELYSHSAAVESKDSFHKEATLKWYPLTTMLR